MPTSPPDDPLAAYRSKRSFAVTPEPGEGGEASLGRRRFVVQKHWASSLHYDFRLELGGTLKSWAVPKGPSLDPAVKRMAVEVEDHPLSYAGFEGSIPQKQYGAGRVIVWDAGTWSPLDGGDDAAQQGLRDGRLAFELHGHKLGGKWLLVRMKAKGERQPAWLLKKEKDGFCRLSAEYSVTDALPDSVKGRAPAATHRSLPPEATVARLPDKLLPPLATLAAEMPADASDWLYEIKFDGYRLLARIAAGGPRLFTRSGHDWTGKLQPLRQAIERLALPPGWYDGEIVVPGEAGVPDFGALQQAFEAGATNEVVYYLFDLPFFDGHDLRAAPLQARRALLRRVLADAMAAAPTEQVRFSEAFAAAPRSVVASACKLGLEGVIAKRRHSRYQSGRSADWQKLKCGQRQEFVIGGYTDPQGARTGIGALLLGVHDEAGALRYAGNVGSGFSEPALRQMAQTLRRLERQRSPFADLTQRATQADGTPHWVAPALLAEVSFGGWTRAGRIRHAVFRGLRSDKPAQAIVRERALRQQTPTATARVKITHPERVIDARSGTTKAELLGYYAAVGTLMMKHLKGRPVAWLRAPAGVEGLLFFQKHAETDRLAGVRELDPALGSGHPAMIEVASRQGLLAAAQWNVIEFHTLNTGTASVAAFNHPDRMVFDLDPGEGVAWVQVQEAAQLMHSLLAQIGLASFLKTSGGKGLHVVVPLRKLHDVDTVKGFSQAVVAHMAKTIPQRFVAKSGPRNRVGKIFIDYLRNGPGATTVSAWSARARPGLGVSVPVGWDELPSLRGGDHWTVKTVQARFAVGNAPWQAYARSARGLQAAMRALGHTLRPA